MKKIIAFLLMISFAFIFPACNTTTEQTTEQTTSSDMTSLAATSSDTTSLATASSDTTSLASTSADIFPSSELLSIFFELPEKSPFSFDDFKEYINFVGMSGENRNEQYFSDIKDTTWLENFKKWSNEYRRPPFPIAMNNMENIVCSSVYPIFQSNDYPAGLLFYFTNTLTRENFYVVNYDITGTDFEIPSETAFHILEFKWISSWLEYEAIGYTSTAIIDRNVDNTGIQAMMVIPEDSLNNPRTLTIMFCTNTQNIENLFNMAYLDYFSLYYN